MTIRQTLVAAFITAAVGIGLGWTGSAFAAAIAAPTEVRLLQQEVNNLTKQVDRLTAAVDNFTLRVDAIIDANANARAIERQTPSRRP